MFTLLAVLVFLWLAVKVVGLALKLTWGTAKILASILFAVALTLLIGGVLFAGGILLVVPVILIGAALGILKWCVS